MPASIRRETKLSLIHIEMCIRDRYEVDKREELDDAGVIAILSKQVKMRKDALADFEKAGRTDLVDAYNAEIEVLNRYLPEQLSREKIVEIVKAVSYTHLDVYKRQARSPCRPDPCSAFHHLSLSIYRLRDDFVTGNFKKM